MIREFLGESGISRKDFAIVFILLFNVFGWYYMTLTIIDGALNNLNASYEQKIIVWTTYYVTVAGSGIAGAILSNRIKRLKFLYLWIISGAVTSLLLVPVNSPTVTGISIISTLLGASFGLGMPSCLAYFADCTFIENRGRVSGTILLTTNLCAPLFTMPVNMFNLMVNSILLAAWRGFGLIIFFLKPEEKRDDKMKKNISFKQVFNDRLFLFFFIAWFMFCFIDRFEKGFFTIREDLLERSFYRFILMVEAAIGSLFALIGGILCDLIGRKRVVIYGFVALGLAYAIIGIFPTMISWYFYSVIDGVAAGILWVTFILILWGDLSPVAAREKYYVVGGIPFFISNVVPLFLGPHVTLLSANAAFSWASFFLFIAVLPLLYAPETLPEKKIELRQLRKYVDAAKKVKEKYAEK